MKKDINDIKKICLTFLLVPVFLIGLFFFAVLVSMIIEWVEKTPQPCNIGYIGRSAKERAMRSAKEFCHKLKKINKKGLTSVNCNQLECRYDFYLGTRMEIWTRGFSVETDPATGEVISYSVDGNDHLKEFHPDEYESENFNQINCGISTKQEAIRLSKNYLKNLLDKEDVKFKLYKVTFSPLLTFVSYKIIYKGKNKIYTHTYFYREDGKKKKVSLKVATMVICNLCGEIIVYTRKRLFHFLIPHKE